MSNLSGKTALVTGASRGIGRASALGLAKAGAQVLVHYNERSVLRVKNFFADLNQRLGQVPFIAGECYSAADITALVTVDFAGR